VTFSFPVVQSLTSAFAAGDFTAVLASGTLLDKLPVFNIMVIPGITNNGVLSAAAAFCENHRAFLIMDSPALDTGGKNLSIEDLVGDPTIGDSAGSLATIPLSANAALYYPYLTSTDPVSGNTIRLPPSGSVAGIFARTDQNRGVWKAPAGLETIINNTTGVAPEGVMTDMQAGVLNKAAIDAIRTFPGQGTVVFGARTTVATNTAFQQWWYVPVRRMALFIEQTLYANLGWVVFEPNDVPLWNAIKSTIERFMLSLFRQGAFQGTTPSDAFLVKCDSSTTTQDDINNGKVNVLVGFAPLKPAEFVIIQITQLTGQASS
jgi:phage tail sheath protein FI